MKAADSLGYQRVHHIVEANLLNAIENVIEPDWTVELRQFRLGEGAVNGPRIERAGVAESAAHNRGIGSFSSFTNG